MPSAFKVQTCAPPTIGVISAYHESSTYGTFGFNELRIPPIGNAPILGDFSGFRRLGNLM